MRFHESAAAMVAAATHYAPDGMLEVRRDVQRMPEALDDIAKAFQITADRFREGMPMHPAFLELVAEMHAVQRKVAEVAGEMPAAFEALHQRDIERLENPRPNEEMWDANKNRSA